MEGGGGNDGEEQKQRQSAAGFCTVSALLARDTKLFFIFDEDDAQAAPFCGERPLRRFIKRSKWNKGGLGNVENGHPTDRIGHFYHN